MYPEQPATVNANQPSRRRNIVLLALLAIAIFAVGLLQWFITNSYLSITVEDTTDGDITYTITNQESGNKREFTTTDTTVKTRLPSGNYEVLVQQGVSAGFAFAETGRFLTTTEVTVPAAPERARTIIGEGVSPCMAYGVVLFSYSCGSTLTGLQAHLPATQDTPPIAKLVPNATKEKIIEGTVMLSGKLHVLIREPSLSVEEGYGNRHVLYPLDESMNLSGGVGLKGFDVEKYYYISEYEDGFLVYESRPTEAYYFKDASSSPETIAIPQPDDENLEAYLVSVSGNRIVVAYQELGETDAIDYDDREATGKPSSVSVAGSGESRQFELDQTYTVLLPCGTDKLCANNGELLNVYDISGEKPELQFSLTGIRDIELLGNEILAIKDDVVLRVNVNNASGTVVYQLGAFQNCGIQALNNSFVICVVHEDTKRYGLLVDLTKPVADEPIDKQLLQLARAESIKTVSAYKNIIHITQELGDPVFNSETGVFDYSDELIAARTQIVDNRILEIGIDRQKYQIIYTY